MESQQSYETLFGRFKNGDTLVQGLADFDPNKDLIKKAALTAFIADIVLKDKAVTLSFKAYSDEIAGRIPLVFQSKECDVNCLVNRLRNIHSYIGADINKTCAAYKKIGTFIKKISPHYKKKDPNAPPDQPATPSPSERTYVAAIGYGQQTLTIIKDLGADYAPKNSFIVPDDFELFVKDLDERTQRIATYEKTYTDAVSARKDIYKGKEGLLKRQTMIKDYLASFPGGKKSLNYIEYDRLIKGR